jgi:hypothetical protein
MMGTSKSKQKPFFIEIRKENAINTHSLEIQKVIIFTNVNILVVFIHSNQVVEFEVHQMMQVFQHFLLPQWTVQCFSRKSKFSFTYIMGPTRSSLRCARRKDKNLAKQLQTCSDGAEVAGMARYLQSMFAT